MKAKNMAYPAARRVPIIQGAKGGGKGGGGGSPRVAQEAPNTLQSRATARLIDLLCAGEIKGLVDGAKSFFFDDTTLQNPDGSYNFQGVAWDFRTGTPDQEHMPGFSEVESEVGVNVQVTYGQPITRSITDQELDAVRVTLRFPALYRQDTANGDMLPYSVSVAIEISTDGGPFQRLVEDTLNDKCTSPYERAYRISLPQGTRWDVRVVRLSGDSTSAAAVNDTWWSSYTRIIEVKMVYPDAAYASIAVDSQLFGSQVPQRAYEIFGKIIQVPSNYNPETRAYSGLWDGTFKRAYSNNPAWCLYDVLTDPVNGLGRELTAERIDKWSLYSIAQYCDEMVPDGLGGTEPRFTFNGVVNTREDALNAVAALAGAFRTIVYFSAGMIYFSQDRPTPYKRLLTPANVINGMFTYEGTGQKARHSVALISWLDPDDGYKTAVETVEDPDAVLELGWRTTDEIAFGCTSRGQAWRHGAMLLDAETHCTTTCTFSTGLDCADIMPGDVIAISDPSHAGVRAGGRLAAVSELGATLDAPFAFATGQSYSLAVTMPDATLQEIALINPAAETADVVFASPIVVWPAVGAIFTVLASDLAPQLFRVMGIEEGEGITFHFSCLQYDPTKYDRVEQGITLPQTPTTVLPSGPILMPHALTCVEYLYLKSGLSAMAGLTFSWTNDDPRAVGFEVEYQAPGYTGFVGRMVVSSLSLDMDLQVQGYYIFRVRAIDGMGRRSQWASIAFNAQALYKPPADVTGFLAEVYSDFLLLKWDQVQDLHLDHYEMRFHPGGAGTAAWGEAMVVDSAVSKFAVSLQLSLQAGTYFIKAVSTKGIYSAAPAKLVNGMSLDFSSMNVVINSIQNPAWTGIKQNVVPAPSGTLELLPAGDGVVSHGYYYFAPAYFDLGAIYTSRLIPMLRSSGHGYSDDLFAAGNIFTVEDIFNLTGTAQWLSYLEYSVTREDPALAEGQDIFALPDIFAATDMFEASQIWTDWVPFTGPVDVQARAYRFRIALESLDGFATPVISAAAVIVDMPDRIVGVNDIALTADGNGHYFEFLPPFKATPALSPPTVQNSPDFYDYNITEKTRNGFRLFLYDTHGAPVPAVVDWIAKGYGAEHVVLTGD